MEKILAPARSSGALNRLLRTVIAKSGSNLVYENVTNRMRVLLAFGRVIFILRHPDHPRCLAAIGTLALHRPKHLAESHRDKRFNNGLVRSTHRLFSPMGSFLVRASDNPSVIAFALVEQHVGRRGFIGASTRFRDGVHSRLSTRKI